MGLWRLRAVYDQSNIPLSVTARSNGASGLDTEGHDTLGELQFSPRVWGTPGFTWNSTDCGTCWELSYTDATRTTRAVIATAADGA